MFKTIQFCSQHRVSVSYSNFKKMKKKKLMLCARYNQILHNLRKQADKSKHYVSDGDNKTQHKS